MGFFDKKKLIERENEYEYLLSRCIVDARYLTKFLKMKEFKLTQDLSFELDKLDSVDEQFRLLKNLAKKEEINITNIQNLLGRNQQYFLSNGEVNLNLLKDFRGVDTTDTLVINKVIKRNEPPIQIVNEYSDRQVYNFLNDIHRIKPRAVCVSAPQNQINNLILLRLRNVKKGIQLSNGSSIFPSREYEEFFSKIIPGNIIVVYP